MPNIDLKSLKLTYNSFRNTNEETIKINVVRLFLILLGYDEKKFKYEYPTFEGKKRVDILIRIKNLIGLVIEVKKPDDSLDKKSCIQLVNYINSINVEWGILTNGNDYILFNNDIKSSAKNKEVLRFSLILDTHSSICKHRNENNLKFFSFNNIFITETTKYFRYLTEFKNEKLLSHKLSYKSFKQYESTIYNYLDYLSSEKFPFKSERIADTFFFKNFLLSSGKSYNNKEIKKKITIINKYRYITSFCELLKSRKEISDNNFKNLDEKDMIEGFNLDEKNFSSNPLTISEINEILKASNKTRNPIRNKLIILFLFYTGINSKEIPNIKINDFNQNNKTININNRIIKLPDAMCNILLNYLDKRKKYKYKNEYLFCGMYNGKFIQLGEENFNRIIKDILKYTNIPTERKKIISAYFFKYSLIRSMLDVEISLQDISKYIGLTIKTLCDYLNENDLNKINYKNIIKKHPYNKALENL